MQNCEHDEVKLLLLKFQDSVDKVVPNIEHGHDQVKHQVEVRYECVNRHYIFFKSNTFLNDLLRYPVVLQKTLS